MKSTNKKLNNKLTRSQTIAKNIILKLWQLNDFKKKDKSIPFEYRELMNAKLVILSHYLQEYEDKTNTQITLSDFETASSVIEYLDISELHYLLKNGWNILKTGLIDVYDCDGGSDYPLDPKAITDTIERVVDEILARPVLSKEEKTFIDELVSLYSNFANFLTKFKSLVENNRSVLTSISVKIDGKSVLNPLKKFFDQVHWQGDTLNKINNITNQIGVSNNLYSFFLRFTLFREIYEDNNTINFDVYDENLKICETIQKLGEFVKNWEEKE